MVAVVIGCTMGAMDVYLVEQNAGARQLGVCALALAGDLFFLLVLRYATGWIGGGGREARLAQRGYAMMLWFLFAFALEIKLYFIYQHYATEGKVPDPLARHTLTLLLSICIPVLYTVLGATELMAQATTSFRKKDELRGRLCWVVLDLLDVLEIQASLWEPQQRVLPLWAEGLTFFYCYGLLLVLPCVSLNELDVQGPRCGRLYPLLSLASVNVVAIFIRGGLLLLCHDQRISSIFMGKNLLAIALKGCAILQRHRDAQATGEMYHRHSQPTDEQLHRHTRCPREEHEGHSIADWPHTCAQATADQACRTVMNDPLSRYATATVLQHTTAEVPPTQAPSEQSHSMDHQLHRHRHSPDKMVDHKRNANRLTLYTPATTGPSISRELRAAPQVQLKSVWGDLE